MKLLTWMAGLGLVAAAGAAVSPDSGKTRALVRTVQSAPELADRARALQQLALVGTAEAVPTLVALLGDEGLGQYARDALEQMEDPAAGAALRTALDRLAGKPLIGVVASLGVRRDREAVDALARLAEQKDDSVAGAALRALGRIGTVEALRVLEPALGRGTPEVRAAAAEGFLRVADELRIAGQPAESRVLYDRVRQGEVPGPWRAAATRGAILCGGVEGRQLLLEQLRSGSPDLRETALGTARELRDDQLVPALVAELEHLEPAWQAAVMAVLVDLRDDRARPAIEQKARGGAEVVRVAALRALGTLGRAQSIPVLLQAIEPPTSEAVAAAALASLARVGDPEADVAISRALSTADATVRVRLIGVLGDRKSTAAIPQLLQFASDRDLEVAKAALRALGVVTSPAGLPQLISLATAAKDDDVKALADRAIVTTAMKVLEPERRADAVVEAFLREKNPATKAALLRPLGAIMRTMGPRHEVFFVVQAALQDPAREVREAAVRCLAEWPDATPTVTLLTAAARPELPAALRESALRGAVRMAGNVAAGRERSPLDVIGAFTQAGRLARTRDERMLVVAGLGGVRRLEALTLLQPYLDDPEVKAEAALAVVQVAAHFPGARSQPAVRALLERIATSGPDEDVKRRAAQGLQGGGAAGTPKGKGGKAGKAGKAGAAATATPLAAATVAAGALFNGRDLGDWDGDPGVWRVRQGVIVGGSLLGNPRNEFLATKRSYRNFVLRLEYRLVGSEGFVNGGVQVRSVRVAQPPNEMSGYQADIGAGHSGSLYDESRRKKFLAHASEELVRRLEKAGDWNVYEIRCEGPKVELRLNGERTVTYTEEDSTVAADGLIALQIHGNCKAEIAFRNLTLEELP